MSGMNKNEAADDFEIEIADDTPDADRGQPRLPEGEEPEIPSEDDLQQYSESVQKRIKKLTFAANEERRQREEAARLRDEAISYAQRKQAEAEELRAKLQRGDETIVSQAQQRVKTQLENAQAKLKAAYEAGDSEAVVAANTQIAELAAEASRLAAYRPRQQPQQPQQAPASPPVQQAPQIPKPSRRAEEWAAKNSWFGTDEEMTALAFGVHERAIRQGVAPDSEAYYAQIDAAIRQRFPEKVGGGESAPRKQPSSVVAPGGRSAPNTPRKVTLTSTQVALARRLGLTPEQYAAQLIKEQKNG